MPNPYIPTLSELAQIRKHFGYNPETGCVFRNLRRRGMRTPIGDGHQVGSQRKDGYWIVGFMGREYLCHRLALFLHTGCWPSVYVDHISGDKTDNSALNLRDASTAQNVFNAPTRSSRSSGLKGTSKLPHGRFAAEIGANGERHYLGVFDTVEEAHAAYVDAAKRLHGEFARLK